MKSKLPASLLAFALLFASAFSAAAFTGPSYPVVEYDTNPAAGGFNTWGADLDELLPATLEEASMFKGFLSMYGWTLTEAYEVQPLSSSFSEYILAEYSDAFAQSRPGIMHFRAAEGLYEGRVYPLSIFGYVDAVSVTAYIVVEPPKNTDERASKIVAGGALVCEMHADFALHTGVPAFKKVYPLGTSARIIRMDAAGYLAKHGKRPFDETAATDFPGGQRVSEDKQQELAALFPWKTPKYDFLFDDHAMPYSLLRDDEYEDSIVKPVYAAVYARHGLPLTKGEAGSLFYNCYYSENVYRSDDNHYAVDFFARWHNGYPDPKNPATDDLPDTWLTWLVVKPLVKNEEGTLDRFYYASDTPQSVIARDMAEYFKDPVNGRSRLAAE